MKEENVEEKKEKAHEGVIYQAQQNFEMFVAKLTTTQAVKKINGQAEIERRGDQKKTKKKRQKGIFPLGEIEIVNDRPK